MSQNREVERSVVVKNNTDQISSGGTMGRVRQITGYLVCINGDLYFCETNAVSTPNTANASSPIPCAEGPVIRNSRPEFSVQRCSQSYA